MQGPSSQRTDTIDQIHHQSQSLGLYQRCHFQDRWFLACRTADTQPELFLLLPSSHKHGFQQRCWAAVSTKVQNRETNLDSTKTVILRKTNKPKQKPPNRNVWICARPHLFYLKGHLKHSETYTTLQLSPQILKGICQKQ